MSRITQNRRPFIDIVFFGSYIFLALTVLVSVYWYSVTDGGLVKKHDFSIPLSLVPFIISTVFITLGNYINMKDESSNKKLTFVGSLLSGVIAGVMGYIAFLVIKTIVSGS